jgi:hypothetical protein
MGTKAIMVFLAAQERQKAKRSATSNNDRPGDGYQSLSPLAETASRRDNRYRVYDCIELPTRRSLAPVTAAHELGRAFR